jgi:hypothetical protein
MLEINIVKTKCMFSHYQNAGQNWDVKIANRMSENMPHFNYCGTAVTSPNLVQQEIKRRLNSSNAYYHSVQNLLSSHSLSKSIKIRIDKTNILPLVLYGWEIGL